MNLSSLSLKNFADMAPSLGVSGGQAASHVCRLSTVTSSQPWTEGVRWKDSQTGHLGSEGVFYAATRRQTEKYKGKCSRASAVYESYCIIFEHPSFPVVRRDLSSSINHVFVN